jgi:hypothetical protein
MGERCYSLGAKAPEASLMGGWMSSWTSGYVAEIGCTHGFCREPASALLSLIAPVEGVRAWSANPVLKQLKVA